MITDVLAFDLRVYDPGAPVFATRKIPESTTDFSLDVVVGPSDPGWRGSAPYGEGGAYFDNDHFRKTGDGLIGNDNKHFQYVGQGAYVDMGYGYDEHFRIDWIHYPGPPPGTPNFNYPKYAAAYASSIDPWFFWPSQLKDVYGASLAPGYNVYDTWSFHYENNGANEDGYWYGGPWHRFDPPTNAWKSQSPGGNDWRRTVDSGVDGLDNNRQLGIDDVRERETAPPYDKPLRGLEVTIRAYERYSRAIRQVRVHQHFMAE